ncbi:inner membrane protein YhjD [Rhodococcus erythropolis]|uniref:inner membrane protein YhjD n=1 Tax=Rhodococcus erythropolis TaxID=1833 RepID=UPI00031227BC|nr:inner membrane protein YhjD [Rhodococcus erythropolis]
MADTDDDAPSFLEKQRAARPWLDHLVRAAGRFQDQKGDYYAAGITYFSVLALIPIMMVAFAVAGFVLAGHPEYLESIQEQITKSIPGSLGDTINTLIDSAIDSRASVGIFGLLGAAYAGLGWMANVRDALTAMWESKREPKGFVRTKLGDAGALIGLALAMVVSLGMSALSSGPVATQIVKWLNLENITGVGVGLRVVSLLLSLLATWAVFLWVIARLPREPVTLRSAAQAALIAAVVFEIFKQVGAIYLAAVTSGPAGVAFGPIIGLLVFVFTASRMLLFCTAWAATTKESMALAFVPPPDPAVISPRIVVSDGASPSRVAALIATGAVAGLGLSGFMRRRPR